MDQLQLKNKILADRYNSLLFKKYKSNIFLVGGYIRDILRGIDSKDRDYIVKKRINRIINETCKNTKGKLIKFKKGNLYRIVTSDGYVLDFSEHLGSLSEDLSKRDFTINALAWSPDYGIVDLFNSKKDIKRKIIRSISKENFIQDPLRIIRAYRFAAEIDGTIENKTRKQIKTLKTRINKVASERITLELFNLLNQNNASKYLKMLHKDNILSGIILLKNNELARNIRAICKLEKGIFRTASLKFKASLKKRFSQNLTYKGLLCLEQIMQNTEKYKKIKTNLCVSNKIEKRIDLALRGNEKLIISRNKLEEELFGIFYVSKDASVDVMILSHMHYLIKEYERFKKVMKKGVLSSEEIIGAIGEVKGSQISKAICLVKREQFNRNIRNKQQALRMIKEKYSKN
jgi:tRNA nucleotidyltransferase/poly(A) polymerase